ncbi:uncharacterized protein LOC135926535 isoform X2 [Gordionus sp. m RMFG-2023]|uniref:uncharacterized protein LOC135926535 isoform X2 n=1 Tax=Gordionus sp. m RMFG-2023 TaxID=3053472 RepID=UPI0031FD761D
MKPKICIKTTSKLLYKKVLNKKIKQSNKFIQSPVVANEKDSKITYLESTFKIDDKFYNKINKNIRKSKLNKHGYMKNKGKHLVWGFEPKRKSECKSAM